MSEVVRKQQEGRLYSWRCHSKFEVRNLKGIGNELGGKQVQQLEFVHDRHGRKVTRLVRCLDNKNNNFNRKKEAVKQDKKCGWFSSWCCLR